MAGLVCCPGSLVMWFVGARLTWSILPVFPLLALGLAPVNLAGVAVCAGSALYLKLNQFACINTVALSNSLCRLENPLGCCRQINID